MRLSILMPVFNEEATLRKAVDRVLAVEFQEGVEIEFVIVNDGSRDRTREILDSLEDPRIRVFHQPRNQGKGAAISRAVQEATGDYVIICDADEEYRPSEIPSLLQPVLDEEAELVYGSRTFGSHTSFSYWYVLGNKGVNLITNILFNAYISDVETCFKLMPLSLYRSLGIREKGFGMEAEVTGKLLARGYRPYEVGISYKARTREEGKKITVKDGFEAIWILVRIRLREGTRTRPPKTPVS
ncbi:glycosyltransferase family 2 protein [Rathayibacter tanaceti]|uniref:Glycosyltransferase n=2 Tax=Rathayibacter tanaceti TaxID=1671680 RepID=A0A166I9V3_9MICO|nr:glycosyltransferase family 2 protein [Rathayibacter tanaceti]KZX22012.1 Poly-beta-1,6-N-acetyl-D-glucosamine synthase [Rathayibacter tanaceti]QHC56015.1 glycosyltransferase [Rathayibacter tanaceti]TCO39138.1 glycosyltransferase involved in cell wall biosynthesis [Rathayibacter tanaceti]